MSARAQAAEDFERILRGYSDDVREAARRLLDDRGVWRQTDFTRRGFEQAIQVYVCSTTRSAWAKKTQAKRAKWFANFDKTMDRLRELLQEGPSTKALKPLHSVERLVAFGSDVPRSVKKPGHSQADRKEFIVGLKRATDSKTKTIALVAAALFDDPNIDERFVRRTVATNR